MGSKKNVSKGKGKGNQPQAAAPPQPQQQAASQPTPIPGDSYVERARSVIDAIAAELPSGSKISTATVRVSLRHDNVPKGIVASAFSRKGYVQVMLPVHGTKLGWNEVDRANNPFSQITTVEEATAIGQELKPLVTV